MTMSTTLQGYLANKHIHYDVMQHTHTDNAYDSARSAHIPADAMVKGVLLKDTQGYVLAAIPACNHLDVEKLNRQLNRQLELAPEDELTNLFTDCQRGAIPALGDAYGVETIWDEQLAQQPTFYIEAGDHEDLIKLSHYDFMELMQGKPHGVISH